MFCTLLLKYSLFILRKPRSPWSEVFLEWTDYSRMGWCRSSNYFCWLVDTFVNWFRPRPFGRCSQILKCLWMTLNGSWSHDLNRWISACHRKIRPGFGITAFIRNSAILIIYYGIQSTSVDKDQPVNEDQLPSKLLCHWCFGYRLPMGSEFVEVISLQPLHRFTPTQVWFKHLIE